MRNLGTNNYSNNFEPQVKSLLDARTKAPTAAALLTKEQWTSSDGNEWVPVAIRVSVVEDPDPSKNGIYILMKEDYTKEENWLQVGSNSASLVTIDYMKLAGIIGGTATSEQIIETIGQETLDKLLTPGKLYVEFTNILPVGEATSIYYSERTMFAEIEGNCSVGIPLILEANITWILSYIGGQYVSSKEPLMKYDSAILENSLNAVASAPVYDEFQRVYKNFKVLKTPTLLQPDRFDTVDLIKEDVDIIKSMEGSSSLYYYGVVSNDQYRILPLSIRFEDNKPTAGNGYFIYLDYFLDGVPYAIEAYFRSDNACNAAAPEVVEVSSPNIVFLNTKDLIDPYRTTNVTLNRHDTKAIQKLFDSSNSEEKTIVYNGVFEANQLLVNLNTYADFGSTNVYIQNVTFIHPFYKVGYSFEINTYDADGSIYATPLVPCTQGIYRSSFTSDYIKSKVSSLGKPKSELSESDAEEAKRILRYSLDGYTIKLADSRENYSTMDEAGYFGEVNVSVSAFDLDYPYLIKLSLDDANYIINAIIDLDSMLWSVSRVSDEYLQTVEEKGTTRAIPEPVIDSSAGRIEWVVDTSTVISGQYILNLEISFMQGAFSFLLSSSNAINFNTGVASYFLVTAVTTSTTSPNILAAGLVTSSGNKITVSLLKMDTTVSFDSISVKRALLTKL